jgi:ribonuclease HI
MTATIHIDGGSRGNPGPASYAVYLERPGLPVVEECDKIGIATNNVAEYTALIKALELAEELGLKSLRIYADSELMVKQIKGIYRVKNADLQPLYTQAKERQKRFDSFSLLHVPREANREADRLCNLALDGSPKPRRTHDVTTPVAQATPTDEAVILLAAAANTWATHGLGSPSIEDVVAQLRAIFTAKP